MIYKERSNEKKPKYGWLEMISGTMFSGKSEELIRRLKRAKYGKKEIQLFKPSQDNRYSEDEVVTHAGEKMKCVVIKSPFDILEHLNADTQIVGIDEIQFFLTKNRGRYEIEEVIEELIEKGIVVIGAGLDRYSTGEHFGPMPYLVNSAKFIDKYHAVCVGLNEDGCGAKSYISYKVGTDTGANEKNVVKLGSFGEYVPLCENCWAEVK